MSLHQRTSSFDIARSNIAGAHVNGLSRPDSSASKSAYRHIDAFHNTDENLQKTQRTRSGSKSNSPTGVVGDVESLDFGLPSIPHGSKRSSLGFVPKDTNHLPTRYTIPLDQNGASRPTSRRGKEADHVSRPPSPCEDALDDYDVAVPAHDRSVYSIETGSHLLFSQQHLEVILTDPSLLLKFTNFLSKHRSTSVPILMYYLDALKALKAISYSNAIAEALEPIHGFEFTAMPPTPTVSSVLEEKTQQALGVLLQDDLPAYITHVYVHAVSSTLLDRVTEKIGFHYQNIAGGLAETYCLSDPSRPDNPLVFASEGFYRTTQYPRHYAIGRNCRFLQGPKTNPFSVGRIRKAVELEREHCEVFLNYRRDGTPFMNLLMCAPLRDQDGKVRYFLGAQLDVSGLVRNHTGLESLRKLFMDEIDRQESESRNSVASQDKEEKDHFQQLSEMFNVHELDTVRTVGGRRRLGFQDDDGFSDFTGDKNQDQMWIHPQPSLPEVNQRYVLNERANGELIGFYQNYFLVRPYPSLGILFASPSVSVPGILQAPLMSRIGGSFQIREDLTRAFEAGRGVTAKIRWVESSVQRARNRWMHATPLLGANGQVGVWMVILVDERGEGSSGEQGGNGQEPAAQTENVSYGRAYRPRSARSSGPSSVDGDDPGSEQPYKSKFTAIRNFEKLGTPTTRKTYKSLAPFSPYDQG